MRKATLRIGGTVAAASLALTLAGVGTAFASPAAKTMTGPEVITGSAHGAAAIANVTPMPLTFNGEVATTDKGFTLGGGNANTHTLSTPVGKLTVTGTGKPDQTQTLNSSTCYETFSSTQVFTFVPGKSTGKFAGATGPGAYRIHFAAYAPRFTSGKHKGQCNPNGNPGPKGAVATFLAAGVLTVNG
jgi:hypothetical protein